MLDKIIAKSERNGAAMRAYPIGILRDEKEVIEKCDMQSAITHKTEKALISAQAVALTTHFFIYKKGDKSNLIEYLADIQKYNWKGEWNEKVNVDAVETVEAVLTVLLNEHSLKSILQKSINFGGDVDTVASLSLAIGKMSDEIEDDLPSWLYRDLENNKFGLDFLKQLDNELLKKII